MGAHSSKYALYIKKAFDTLDKNHDGKITVEELQVGTFLCFNDSHWDSDFRRSDFKKMKILQNSSFPEQILFSVFVAGDFKNSAGWNIKGNGIHL